MDIREKKPSEKRTAAIKILFIASTRVGDTVLTTGLIAWLAQEYPGAKFTIACGPYGADLLRAAPGLERLIVVEKKKWKKHWFDLWRQCIGVKWDLVVDLRGSAIAYLLCAKRRAINQKKNDAHKVVNNAATLGLDNPPSPHIWLTQKALQEAERLLPADGRPILSLGPTSNSSLKQWPIEYFVHLARLLTDADGVLADAIIMVIADERERGQVIPLLHEIPDARRIEIIGYDLQTVAACLQHARLFVGNDSGLMHLSAALGTPTLGLFGPASNPHVYGPWGEQCAYVSSLGDAEKMDSMRSLSVEQVYDAAKALVGRI